MRIVVTFIDKLLISSIPICMIHTFQFISLLISNISRQFAIETCTLVSWLFTSLAMANFLRTLGSIESTVMVTAILGNSLIIATIYRHRHLRTIQNLIILNLSIVDFLFAAIVNPICIASFFRGEKTRSEVSCHISGIFSLLFSIVSINTLVFISIERYMATNFPIKHRNLLSIKRIKITLGFIWLWSAFLCILPLKTSRFANIPNFFHCSVDWAYHLPITLSYLTVVILVPHLILVYCNIRVFQATRSMRKVSVFLSAPSRYSKGIQQCREHRITVVTFMVTITFLVCWMPYCIATICLASGKSDLPKEFTSVALMMAIANSCCNPIIYGIMNRSFRKAFREILCCVTYKDN